MKVRFIGGDGFVLTNGKIYDVIKYIHNGGILSASVVVKNDLGNIGDYSYLGWFDDVTTEYRNDIIKEILL